MTAEKPLFQKRDGNLAVEVHEIDGHRTIELLRQYEKDGEWRVTGRLGYADQHRGAKLLKEAKDWVNAQDRAEGEKREAERQKKEPRIYSGEPAGARFRRLAREKREAAGMER
jgi:hypothetical protein